MWIEKVDVFVSFAWRFHIAPFQLAQKQPPELDWEVDMGKHLPQTLRAAFFPLARKTYQNCVNAGWEVKFETSKWVKDKEGYKIPHVIHSLFLGTFKGVLA